MGRPERSTKRIPDSKLSHIRLPIGIQQYSDKAPIFRSDTSHCCISIVVVHATQILCRLCLNVPVTQFPPSRSESGLCWRAGRGISVWINKRCVDVARKSSRVSSLCIVRCVSTMFDGNHVCFDSNGVGKTWRRPTPEPKTQKRTTPRPINIEEVNRVVAQSVDWLWTVGFSW